MDKLQQRIEGNIREHGWHCQYVGGDEAWPEFAYSIGFGLTRDWPEVLIIGARQKLAHGMLWRIWESDAAPKPESDRTDILDGFTCKMRPVDRSWFDDLFGRALWAYSDRGLELSVVQCIWPTTSGVFPWDPDAPDGFAERQPLVSGVMPPGAVP